MISADRDPEGLLARSRLVPKATRAAWAVDFADLFARWERYRLYFNAVLVAENLLGALALNLPASESATILFFLVLLNVGFCTGMVAHGYARLLGFRGEGVGPILFVIEMSVAIVLTGVSLLGMSIGLPVD